MKITKRIAEKVAFEMVSKKREEYHQSIQDLEKEIIETLRPVFLSK